MKRILLLLLFASPAFAQTVRWDFQAATTGNPVGGSNGGTSNPLVPVLAIPRATITFCGYVSPGGACTLAVTTYTTAVGGGTCSAATPLTRPNAPGCFAQADNNGNFGAWFNPGQVFGYTIASSFGTFGPFPVNAPGGGGGGGCTPTSSGGHCIVDNPTTSQNIVETFGNQFSISAAAGDIDQTTGSGSINMTSSGGINATEHSSQGISFVATGTGGFNVASNDTSGTGLGITLEDMSAGITILEAGAGGLSMNGGSGGADLNGGGSSINVGFGSGGGGLTLQAGGTSGASNDLFLSAQTNHIELHSGTGGNTGFSYFDTVGLNSGDAFAITIPRATGILALKGTVSSATAPLCANGSGGVLTDSGCTGGGGGAVSAVSNSDGTLTISPTTGAVVASLALGHANTWTALQTHSAGINFSGGSSPLQVGGSAGTSGFCLLSAGAGATPTWTTCPTGSSGISGLTANFIPKAGSATTITANSHIDDGATTASTLTATEPFVVNDGSGRAGAVSLGAGTAPTAAAASTIKLQAPTAITAYNVTLPGAQPTGNTFMACTGANPAVCGWQTQLFYSQAADTIASIETECSSLCTYVVTQPQTMTLGADHALSANVQLAFMAGGVWTLAGGHTLTIAGNVSGTLNSHFAGATVVFGGAQAMVPVEWFGAIGDWNGSTGTDNTAAIQAALNAVSAGQVLLQAKAYKVISALSIPRGGVGIAGTAAQSISSTFDLYPSSRLVTTSASADIVDVFGASSSNYIFGNKFTEFGLERSVVPTGTAAGLSMSFVVNAVVRNVVSNDSIRCFYLHSVPAGETGVIENTRALFGFNGVAETSGNLYGYYLDSADGVAQNSLRLMNGGASNNTTGTTTYGMILTGSAINDVITYDFETAGLSYGQYVVYTGGGNAFAGSDIHFVNGVQDDCLISCYFISGVTAAIEGDITIFGGRIQSKAGTGKLVDIESSFGVSVIGAQISVGQFTPNLQPIAGVSATGSSGLIIANNIFTNFRTNSILLNTTTNSVVSGNSFNNVSTAAATTDIALTGSSGNNVTGNNLSGFATAAVTLESTSTNNSFSGNVIDSANIAKRYVDSGVRNNFNVPTSQAVGLLEDWYSQENQGTVFVNSGYDFTNKLTGTSTTQATATGFAGKVTTYNGTTSTSVASSATNTEFDGTLPFSVCAKINVTVPGSGESVIVTGLDAAGAHQGFTFRLNNDGSFDLYLLGTVSFMRVTSAAGIIVSGVPHQACFTYDGSQAAAGLLFWLDGVSITTTIQTDTFSGTLAGTTPIHVGAEEDGTLPMTGAIGNVRVWNRQLTSVDFP